jgi:hypothetical protein
MTYEEFLSLQGEMSALPVLLLDGRIGLCPHWTHTHVLVDVYENSVFVETIHIPFAKLGTLADIKNGALIEQRIDALYPDCVRPLACACREHLPPGAIGLREHCAVPEINATADKLGWRRPYPDVEQKV